MPAGRPTKYSKALATRLCAEIAQGKSLRKTCKAGNMPTVKTIYNWFGVHDDFLQQYARAKIDSADANADKIEDIAERVLLEEYDPTAARVAIDAFKWTASKKQPKKYGDLRHIEHSGAVKLGDMSDEELQAKLATLQNDSE